MDTTPPKNNNKVWIPLIVTLILVTGFGLGILAQRYLLRSKPLGEYINREDPIDEIINLIDADYIESISKDSLYKEAVNGILGSLDPFTVYMSAQQIARSSELLSSKGKGIGIEYIFINDTMVVSYINPESPAIKSGLKIGDQILIVNGILIAGAGMKESEVINLFKNSESDTLSLSVIHYNYKNPQKVSLVKNSFKRTNVNVATMLQQDIGYIKFNIFSDNIYNDVTEAIERLQSQGMKKLILDIRNNGGGYLDEAILLADEFIDDEKLILYTKGKRDGKTEYNAGIKGVFESGELIILVNGNSASSSEVLAGSIQDWDRGVILGEITYGKGLVQEQFDLTDGSALRLTTARYHTPSGRSIQKPFVIRNVPDSVNNTLSDLNAEYKLYYSLRNNRPLKGLGGITPDIILIDEANQISDELKSFIQNLMVEKFVNKYYFTSYKQNFSFNSFEDFSSGYTVDRKVLDSLYEYLLLEDAVNAQKIWRTDRDLAYLKKSIKAYIAKLEYDQTAYYKVLISDDIYLKRSIEILESEQYNRILKNPNL